MNETDIAWAAGFFDGEGTVTIRPQGGTHVLSIGVAQIDPKPLQKLVDMFGGSVYGPYTHKGNHADSYVWNRWSAGAAEFLSAILPYCVSKSEQIKVGLEYHQYYLETKTPGKKTPDEVRIKRASYAPRLRALRYGYYATER